MLPKCTVNGITWVDSLFTATKCGVCDGASTGGCVDYILRQEGSLL